MRITAEHVLEFLELSNDIREVYMNIIGAKKTKSSLKNDHESSVMDEVKKLDNNNKDDASSVEVPLELLRENRHKSNDGATVGNDVVADPITTYEHVKRLFPGLLRVEVLDRKTDHPLRKAGVLDNHRFVKEHPPSSLAYYEEGDGGGGGGGKKSVLDPTVCCEEGDDARGKMTAHPKMEEVVMWESKFSSVCCNHIIYLI